MRNHLLAAGVLGTTGVALGAFGAHGLPGYLEGTEFAPDEIAKRLETFITGTRYQLHSAVALAVFGLIGNGPLSRWATRLMAIGAIVFCGLLYVLAIAEGWRWLGAVVPIGGLAMIGSWVLIVLTAFQEQEKTDQPTNSKTGLEQEVIRLEEVITHQQQLVQELNEAVTMTSGGADETARRLQSMEQTVKRLVEQQQGAIDAPDERPPHY